MDVARPIPREGGVSCELEGRGERREGKERGKRGQVPDAAPVMRATPGKRVMIAANSFM